jgi:hypothetical protein
MLTPESIRAAHSLVKEADRAFAVGDARLGSQRLWDAAAALVAIIAKQRGWPHQTPDDLGDAAERLSEQCGYTPDLGAEFGAAEYLLENARHGFMRPYELDSCRESVQRFIRNLQAST